MVSLPGALSRKTHPSGPRDESLEPRIVLKGLEVAVVSDALSGLRGQTVIEGTSECVERRFARALER